MVTLAFDGRMGASGDMLLGALLAAGADRERLAIVEEALDVRYAIDNAVRSGISATTVDVLIDDGTGSGSAGGGTTADNLTGSDAQSHEQDQADRDGDSNSHDHGHGGDHGHDHGPGGGHGHTHHHGEHAEGSGPSRTYPEVVGVVESMGLPAAVERDAIAIFERLAEAEASVHGTEVAATEFHEVGADDAIADVVGASLLLADLEPDRVVTTPLSVGSGEVATSHGVYPVPPPAVVELVDGADWSVRGGPIEAELLTPTGAAILAHVAEGVETLPSIDVEQSGYGAGTKSFDSRPNVLRTLLGETTGQLRRDPITVLETNLDDATPETLGSLQETLVAAGALDVSVLPATMKKSRPGHLVKVIVRPDDARRVARRLAAETGTLGVREHGSGHRFVADRSVETVDIELDGQSFEVGVKVARFSDDAGGVYDVSAEDDDAIDVARAAAVPVREVRRRAERATRAAIRRNED